MKKGLEAFTKKRKLWYGTVISRLDRCAGRARAPDAERFVATGSAGDKYTGKRPALRCRCPPESPGIGSHTGRRKMQWESAGEGGVQTPWPDR